MATSLDHLEDVDVLVNNAADDARIPLEDLTFERWQEQFSVNLTPHLLTVRAVAPTIRRQWRASIINLGSITWRAGFGGVTAYATAKAGIEGLTRSLARELGPYLIRVNCIIPGWVMTERQLRDWVTPEAEETIARSQCLPGCVMPGDIAAMALWLASDDSRMCTNQTWIVDGGWL